MTIRFDNRVAIVTGAGNGLGRAHALELAKRGAKVVVNDFGGARDGSGGSQTAAEKVVEEITTNGGEAMANAANVADHAQCIAMAEAALSRWGRIDILINNAGILRDKSFAKMPPEDWRAVIDVHLNGSANCTMAVWNAMKEGNYGRILLTTSTSGVYGNFGQSNYGAAKMGLVGLMNTLCIEGAKNNIRVNCISPTAATRMTEDILTPDMLAALNPEFVTPAAAFLVSEDAPNRTVMFAGAGSYSVMEIRESKGMYLPAENRNADAIAASYAAISDMQSADTYTEGREHVTKILTNAAKNKA
ncbi:MAG: SDR family oxidoreductase [Nitratireductor sp.]|nr:SDR family oxidoreductase [Nitratireductor sp.]MCB1455029.1 SDR family oxidoreductase [Nitratireductor sp.]